MILFSLFAVTVILSFASGEVHTVFFLQLTITIATNFKGLCKSTIGDTESNPSSN